ncbi:MAG: response regulator [Bacteroidales bacterium]|nr:response regulator [Bacteroidales bacterium]
MRILVAEDNPLNQKIISTFLGRNNHDVIMAKDGLEAVELFQQYEFDCILMDLHMPNMDGFQATEAIRSIEKGMKIPIIAVTASSPLEDKSNCIGAGMNDFIQKPVQYIDIEFILQRVESGYYTIN